MNIIAIGNSFSEDSQHYLHSIANADRVSMKVVNLRRSGCFLERHYYNMMGDVKDYVFEQNGVSTGIKVSIKEGLESEKWDVVVMQQASFRSYDYNSYQPYLNELSKYVKLYAPNAKQILNQTWSFKQGSDRLKAGGYEDQYNMYQDLTKAYKKAAQAIGAEVIIPSGQALQYAITEGFSNLYRDELHVSLGVGRYLVGLVWYGALGFSDNIMENNFNWFDGEESIAPDDILKLKKCALKALDTKL